MIRNVRTAFRKIFGFTLVELIVVITILAILATIGFLALSGYSEDARSSAVAANVRSVQTAISAESALTNNSARYYVIHNSGAALSGAFVYLDNSQTYLTGGDWNVPGTNYSAGNPDYAKLKLNPEKFRTAGLSKLPQVLADFAPFAFAAYGSGLYDSKYLTIGAMDATYASGDRKRTAGYFQVVGISSATGKATVAGNYPGTVSLSGSVVGLVAADPTKSATGAVVDGVITSVSAQVGCPGSVQAVSSHSYSVPSANNGATTSVTSAAATVTGGTQTYSQSFSCSNGVTAPSGTETSNAPSCSSGYSNVSGTCVPATCKSIKTAYPASVDGTYSIDPDGTGANAAFVAYCDMTTDGGGWTNINYNFGNVVALTANNGISVSGVSSSKINGPLVSIGTNAGACGASSANQTITYYTDALNSAVAFTEVLYNVKSYGISDVRCG